MTCAASTGTGTILFSVVSVRTDGTVDTTGSPCRTGKD
jgi:hypothetical protein